MGYLDMCCLISNCFSIFQIFFCYQFFCLILLWFDDILCIIPINLNMLICFITLSVVYLSDCSMWAWRKIIGILLSLDEVMYKF